MFIGGTNYYFTQKLNHSIEVVGKVELPVIRLMTQAGMMHDAMRAAVFASIVFAEETEKAQAAKDEYEEFSKNFFSYLSEIEKLKAADSAILQKIGSTRAKVTAYHEAGLKIIAMSLAGKGGEAKTQTDSFMASFGHSRC